LRAREPGSERRRVTERERMKRGDHPSNGSHRPWHVCAQNHHESVRGVRG
jgi:hypothetical protein